MAENRFEEASRGDLVGVRQPLTGTRRGVNYFGTVDSQFFLTQSTPVRVRDFFAWSKMET